MVAKKINVGHLGSTGAEVLDRSRFIRDIGGLLSEKVSFPSLDVRSQLPDVSLQ